MPQDSATPASPSASSTATLRKSCQKSPGALSGIMVRMRTVFVPYVLLPEKEVGTALEENDVIRERQKQEAGNEECTLVLCVEIEHSDESEGAVGYEINKVDVFIGGEGTHATLIGWGDGSFSKDAAKKTFPLVIGPLSQFNLLYVVTFLRSPEEEDSLIISRLASTLTSSPLQRAISITVFGKPYIPSNDSHPKPTETFSSNWNCVLDLSTHHNHTTIQYNASDLLPNILPEPSSPFPAFSKLNDTNTPNNAVHTKQFPKSGGNRRISELARTPLIAGRPQSRSGTPTKLFNNTLSSQSMSPGLTNSLRMPLSKPNTSQPLRTTTTYSAPPIPRYGPQESEITFPHHFLDTLQTPVYPAYPARSMLPPTPLSLPPHGGAVPSVEVYRDRCTATPPTQTPVGSPMHSRARAQNEVQKQNDQIIVVSVGLLPLSVHEVNAASDKATGVLLGQRRINPFDVFTLDIFLINQSSWLRRLEVSCPVWQGRGGGEVRKGRSEGGVDVKVGLPGVMPLDGRVRIGPLRPSACQSVRMSFVAISPGVHSIDPLTLTDVETDFAINLRSVLDIVVHDPNG